MCNFISVSFVDSFPTAHSALCNRWRETDSDPMIRNALRRRDTDREPGRYHAARAKASRTCRSYRGGRHATFRNPVEALQDRQAVRKLSPTQRGDAHSTVD